MKLLRILYLLFAVILFTTSCSRTNDRLLQAEQLIESSPDSAMAILNKYSYNKLSDKDKALYGLLYTEIKLSKKIILQSDTLINFSIKYYEKENEPDRIASCYLYKGRLLKYAFQYEKAMDYYLKAIDNTDKNTSKALLGRVNFDMADIYSFQSDYSLARNKYIISYNYYVSVGFKKQAFYSLLNIGRTYNSSKQFNKAATYYRKISNYCNDSILKGDLYQEIGQNFYEYNKLDSAYTYLIQSVKYPFIGGNKAIRLNFLAKVYFDFGKYDSSFYFANQAFKFSPDLKVQRESYRIMTNCEFIKGSTKNVTKYMNKYVSLGDTIRKIELQTKGSYIETMHNTQRKVAKSLSWIWYLLVLVLLIFVLAILFYVRKHRKGIQTIKTIEEKQLVQKKESVQEIVERTKEALHKSLKEKRIELTKKIKQNTPEGRREMILQLYDESVHFKNKQHFKNEMDNTLNNLYSKLETSYPKLKTKEKQWACLNMLDIPKDDCIQLLDFNTESFKKMRQRFAQKIGVDTVTNIDAVLKKILYDAT